MNFNNYTIKSQEAIQRAQQLAQGLGQQDIQVEHIFKGIQEVDFRAIIAINIDY